MHRLLKRQLDRHAGGADDVPEEWAKLIESVNDAYNESDVDRAMLERSLELSSKELIETNVALADQKVELERSNEELQRFAYIASHDLQEPLRTVQSYLQLLQRRYKDKLDTDADEFIEFAVEGSTRMRALIEDLLKYARVTSQAEPFQLTPLEEVVDDTLTNLGAAVAEHGASVERDPLPELPIDRRQVSQLYQNLISNALKFKREGIAPEVHLGADKTQDGWKMWVRDNGIGMNGDYTERVFAIFQRLHTREEYEGTGIGLALCKKIVERHHGKIWVESELGAGSTFFFTLAKGST